MITDRIELHSVLLPLQIKNIKLWYKFYCVLPENIHTCPPPHTDRREFSDDPLPSGFSKIGIPLYRKPPGNIIIPWEIKSRLFVSDTESLS